MFHALQQKGKQQSQWACETQGPNQKHLKIKLEWACDVLGPSKERKKNRVGLGCTRPKNGGVSVIRKMVKLVLISVSVSVRENLNYLNGVVIYIYILIYNNNKFVKS